MGWFLQNTLVFSYRAGPFKRILLLAYTVWLMWTLCSIRQLKWHNILWNFGRNDILTFFDVLVTRIQELLLFYEIIAGPFIIWNDILISTKTTDTNISISTHILKTESARKFEMTFFLQWQLMDCRKDIFHQTISCEHLKKPMGMQSGTWCYRRFWPPLLQLTSSHSIGFSFEWHFSRPNNSKTLVFILGEKQDPLRWLDWVF